MLEPLDRKVLIVDDEEHVKSLLSEFFSFNGYDVILANNGREALEILKNEHCSLLITDLKMPGINGVELVVKIRNLDISLPIIGISSENKESEFLKAGANYFLLKPFSIHHLKSIVSLIFGR
jgi:DNA-binding response OmpR family regulator